jgi:hypothetical protein
MKFERDRLLSISLYRMHRMLCAALGHLDATIRVLEAFIRGVNILYLCQSSLLKTMAPIELSFRLLIVDG